MSVSAQVFRTRSEISIRSYQQLTPSRCFSLDDNRLLTAAQSLRSWVNILPNARVGWVGMISFLGQNSAK